MCNHTYHFAELFVPEHVIIIIIISYEEKEKLYLEDVLSPQIGALSAHEHISGNVRNRHELTVYSYIQSFHTSPITREHSSASPPPHYYSNPSSQDT